MRPRALRRLPGAAVTAVLETRGLSRAFTVASTGSPFAGMMMRRRSPRLVAVDKVDIAIAPGEAVGLVGESGCGKSTLARLVARLIEPDAGEILLDGEPIHGVPANRFARSPLRRRIQMVFQDPTDSLNPQFSVRDAIADPVRQLMRPMTRAAVESQVERAAAQVGLPSELFTRFPHQLSGGQKARVGIARAMSVEPRLLILDEPTSALDVSVQALVLKLLVRLRREAGVAQLFVSHDLNVVRLLCDRIVVMYLGQVIEQGPSADIFNAPRHPYTRALLSAIPRLPGSPRTAGERLDGEPRSPIDPDPNSCCFYGRCRLQRPECARIAPRPTTSGGRLVRCHFPIQAGETAAVRAKESQP